MIDFMPVWERLSRTRTAAAVVVLMSLVLAGCSGGHHASPARSGTPGSAAPSTPSAWQTLLRTKIKPDGTVDKTTALQAFSLAIAR